MFVEITTPKKPLEAEKIYNRCYRGREEITPEVCMEVLKSTNYAACIKRMLLCVEKLPKEKQGAFKEAVLSVFDHREQPDDVVAVGERLAVTGGYDDKLRETVAAASDVWRGDVLLSSAESGVIERVMIEDDAEDFIVPEALKYKKKVILDCRGLIWLRIRRCENLPEECLAERMVNGKLCGDMRAVKRLTLGKGCFCVEIKEAKLPQEVVLLNEERDTLFLTDTPLTDDTKITARQRIGVVLEGMYDKVPCAAWKAADKLCIRGGTVVGAGLALGEKQKAVEFSSVAFEKGAVLDLRAADGIQFSDGELNDVTVLTGDEARVSFNNMRMGENVKLVLGENASLSMNTCDLKGADIVGKGVFEADMKYCQNMPAGMSDVIAGADRVYLAHLVLPEAERLAFKEEAIVSMSWVDNLPGVLDVSKCERVTLEACDFSATRQVVMHKRHLAEKAKYILLPKKDLNTVYAAPICKEASLVLGKDRGRG